MFRTRSKSWWQGSWWQGFGPPQEPTWKCPCSNVFRRCPAAAPPRPRWGVLLANQRLASYNAVTRISNTNRRAAYDAVLHFVAVSRIACGKAFQRLESKRLRTQIGWDAEKINAVPPGARGRGSGPGAGAKGPLPSLRWCPRAGFSRFSRCSL